MAAATAAIDLIVAFANVMVSVTSNDRVQRWAFGFAAAAYAVASALEITALIVEAC